MADGRWHDHLMFVAAQYGHLHVLTYFYDVFAMYDMHDVFETCKHDILGFASRHGHIDIVKFLLDNGADPSQHAEYAFLRACYYNHRDVVELLLASYTPSPAIVSKAIENVIGECHCDMYERLMMLPNDGLDDATLVYNTLLANTSSGLKVFQMMQRLHAHGVNILTDVQRDGSIDRDDMMKSTTSALALAARRGHMLVVQMLVGMDVTQEMKDDALAWAVIHKYHKMMSYLIKHGANVKAKNNRALRVAEEVENCHAVLRLTKLCK
jgi:ankyrin repeat protein